jgi:CheY-like chemotaxis protein
MSKPFALVIEDDPILGAVYQAALGRAGYEAALDPDGNRFLSILADKDPALIVLDVHMPFASGEEILTQLRADRRWLETPIIVTTADLFAARTFQGKVDQVLIKPVSVTRLIEIATHLASE